jgi:hypothetical protein
MTSRTVVSRENAPEWIKEQELESRDDEVEVEPDMTAIAHSLTWEGYGSLDLESRRKMIRQLWALYERQKGTVRSER